MGANWILSILPTFALAAHAGVTDKVPIQSTRCDQGCLRAVLNRFFESLSRHDPSLLPITRTVRFTFDGAPTKVGQQLWQHAGAVSYRLDAIDPQCQQAAANAVIGDNGHKSILFVRLKVKQGKVDELETVLVRPGEGQRSDPEGLSGEPSAYQERISPAQRQRRQQLIATAEAYFQGIADAGTAQYRSPPLAPDMIRVENGIQAGRPPGETGPAPSIDEQLRHGFGRDRLYVSERRYPVVDGEHGIVVAVGVMHVDRPPGPPPPFLVGLHTVDSAHLRQILVEFFKVQAGTIRQIQATMYDLNDPKTAGTGWVSTSLGASSSHGK